MEANGHHLSPVMKHGHRHKITCGTFLPKKYLTWIKSRRLLASICCPQRRETKANTLKATEANRKRGAGTREKVRSKRINLEGNTHAQEVNASQIPV
jgi:hypothetical protein